MKKKGKKFRTEKKINNNYKTEIGTITNNNDNNNNSKNKSNHRTKYTNIIMISTNCDLLCNWQFSVICGWLSCSCLFFLSLVLSNYFVFLFSWNFVNNNKTMLFICIFAKNYYSTGVIAAGITSVFLFLYIFALEGIFISRLRKLCQMEIC